MRKLTDLYPYQSEAVRFAVERPRCLLFLECGLGKTAVTLTALSELMEAGEIARALIVAPKKVAEATWQREAAEWEHLAGLRFSTVLGTARQREAALKADADVYVTSRDLFVWLCEYYNFKLPFSALVLDELTSFKTPSSLRSKAARRLSVPRVIGLTGTPAPNGLIDLWAEAAAVDGGASLGKSFTRFRDTYFDFRLVNHIPMGLRPKPGAREAIEGRLQPVALAMRAVDYLQLPPLVEVDVPVVLPPEALSRYREMKREMCLEIDDETLTASTAAVLLGKLSQMANGAVYGEEGAVHACHGAKLDALAEVAERGRCLVFYQYKHDADAISARFPQAVRYQGLKELDAWNRGEVPMLLCHPASVGYGLNMQAGGCIAAWYGTGWNLEQYQQANARLHRGGQTRPVTVYRLIAAGTVDERAAAAINAKATEQVSLMEAMRREKADGFF